MWLVGLEGTVVAGPITIERSREYHREWLIKFAGVDQPRCAGALARVFVAVPEASSRRPRATRSTCTSWTGFAVRLEDGTPLGLVSAVYELPAGLMIEVQGPKREFLLPYKKEFVREVDRASGGWWSPPEGLVE